MFKIINLVNILFAGILVSCDFADFYEAQSLFAAKPVYSVKIC